MFLKTFNVLAATLAPILALADAPVPTDHSTVHIMFVVPYETPVAGGTEGTRGSGSQPTAVPRAIVGDLLLPIQSIQPISISINGEFVGHAMPGTSSISPVFVLPIGQHKFEFSSDVFGTKKVDLRVIGTGSKQYLIVKLLPKTSSATTNQSTDNSTPTTNAR